MKFPYTKIPSADSYKPWIARPIIPIIISSQHKSVRVDALIDSGADRCVFHHEIGKRLGIELEKGNVEHISGIEGIRSVMWIHSVFIQILGSSKRIKVEAGFTKSSGVFAILGQEGFFDAFRIKFEKDRNIIEMTLTKD